MPLETTLDTVTQNLREGRYPNEQAVSVAAVVPVLADLGWDTRNPSAVWPEYSVGGRVDFALCYPLGNPRVFLEVKALGNLAGGDEQLFGYALTRGVQMLVLTDGRMWSFYLPGEQGSYDDRRVFRLDIMEEKRGEAASILTRYLSQARVASGAAVEEAAKELRGRSSRKLAMKTIRSAWDALVKNEDPGLLEAISAEVKAQCHVKPEPDDVVAFLRGLTVSPPSSVSATSAAVSTAVPRVQQAPGARAHFELRGSPPAYFRTAQDVMVGVLQELARRDSDFPAKCHDHPENAGRRRTYIGRAPSELYPGRPDLEEFSIEFVPGWFVTTNVSNAMKERIVRMACAVAGLGYGTDLKAAW